MRGGDGLAARKVGDRARDAQDAMHRTRRKLQRLDRAFERRLIRRREPAHRHRLRLIEPAVERARARELACARTHHARTDDIAGFPCRRVGSQLGGRQSRDFEMQVDAFEQRA